MCRSLLDCRRLSAVSMGPACRLGLLALVGILSTTAALPVVAADEKKQTRVGALIEELGAESYATRLRAREELQRMGLEAFDELHLAQYHPDNEIAMAARFLVSSLAISWSKETDPPEVRNTLVEYGAQEESERGSRIDRLAEFPGRKGLDALVRLARFETSLRLSRRAALAIMQQPMSDSSEERSRNAKQILQSLADNQRQAAEWLRVYAKDLAGNGYSQDRWRELIAAQRQQIDSAATEQSSRDAVLELVRVSATRAARAGKKDEALALASEHLDLIVPNTRELINAVNWAIDHDLHPFVLRLQREYETLFDEHPLLLYGAAEALNVAGREAEAEQTAGKAAAIQPLPQSEEELAKMQPREVEDRAQTHRELGLKLEERGLFRWAEREFRHIIDSLDLDSNAGATARLELARMWGELLRHQEVVDVLKPLTDRIEKDSKFRRALSSRLMFQYNRIRSDVDYHAAMALIEEGKSDEAKPLLAKAFRIYPANIDILIQMYRMEGDDDWESMVEMMLTSTIRRADSEVQDARAELRQLGAIGEQVLGQQLNQYAWLVSNTRGDYQKALAYSLQSLELEEDAARLDTCARCYYAVGDLENALLMQRRALKLMPHSPPLKRQLAELQAAQQAASNQPE